MASNPRAVRRCDELDLYACGAGWEQFIQLQGGKRGGAKSGMQVRRGAFRRFDAALHGLLGIAIYRTQEGQRRHARCEHLLIGYCALVAGALRAATKIAARPRVEGATARPLFFELFTASSIESAYHSHPHAARESTATAERLSMGPRSIEVTRLFCM
jgi:hypothetical protein